LDPDQRLTSPARSSQEKPGPRRGVAARDASSPQPFQPSKEHQNGVLTVTIDKREVSAPKQGRSIPING
ncbi:HSP20 family small heat-shock protein, partial [Escherichia coli]|nr:HSP20 family small heat-shock protein [Escherichia coli]MCT7431656.1 HSP20 family small heat-shock protein [Escherichia coli]